MSKLLQYQPSLSHLAWLGLILSALVLSFGISWLLLVPLDFAYGWLYSLIDIDQHIARYGPANMLKQGFESTSDAERCRLFSEIVTAIHAHGAGLEGLQYHNKLGAVIGNLLTQDEVIHLQDVAILIDRLIVLLWIAIACFVACAFWIYRSNRPLPTFRSILTGVLGFIGAVIAVIMVIGPHKVFYMLHVWVFPKEHKWFFYYEESLMSTMMKAPDLFAYIAILLLVLAVPIFSLIMWLVRRVLLRKLDRASAA